MIKLSKSLLPIRVKPDVCCTVATESPFLFQKPWRRPKPLVQYTQPSGFGGWLWKREVMITHRIQSSCLTLEKLAMKKSLVALAALAVAGVASAQSSVTLFGVVDASISGYSATARDNRATVFPNQFGVPVYLNQGSVKTSSTQLANSGYNSSRIGFRGTEDLGGGLAASFWLEAPISNDDGQTGISTFARRSTVSLSG
eukprot:gene32795-55329_t